MLNLDKSVKLGLSGVEPSVLNILSEKFDFNLSLERVKAVGGCNEKTWTVTGRANQVIFQLGSIPVILNLLFP
jgi:hypothetical protein